MLAESAIADTCTAESTPFFSSLQFLSLQVWFETHILVQTIFLRPYIWNYSMPQDGTIELATNIKKLKYSSCGCAEDICKSTLGLSYKTVILKQHRFLKNNSFSSVQPLSPTLCDPKDCSTPGFPIHTNPWNLLKLMTIVLVMPSNHFILCHPLLLLPSIIPSIRVFSNESVLRINWSKYWSFSFSISPSNEYSGLISFRMDQVDLLAVQGTLKNLLQCHSSKASMLQHSTFFTVQLSNLYMSTGKTIALTRWTFVGKVMSLLFFSNYFYQLEANYFTVLQWFLPCIRKETHVSAF